jgi:hypothetical protein
MRAECERCGSQPVQLITTRKHLGLIVFGKTWQRQQLLCRNHARMVLAGDLVFSAVLGWWGVLSLFINAGVVIAQIQSLSGVSGLAAPGPGRSV